MPKRRDSGRGSRLLETAARFLNHLDEIDRLMQSALDEGMRELRANRGLICLLSTSSGMLEVRYTAGSGWDERSDLAALKVRDEPGGGITGHVAATAEPYYAPDVTNDPYYVGYWRDVRTELGLPLRDSNGNAIGVIVLESTRIDAFSEDQRTFAAVLADAAAAALTAADYRDREKALIEVGKELASIKDIRDLMQKVVDLGANLLRAQDCTLFLISDDKSHVVLAASYGPLRERAGQASYRIGQGLTGWVAENGQPVRVRQVMEDPRWAGLHVEMPREGLGAFMAVPVRASNGVLGVLRVVRRKRKYIAISQQFTTSDQDLLETLASQVGVAIENYQLVDRVIRSERLATWGEMSARAAHMIGNRVFAIKGALNELKYELDQQPHPQPSIGELVGQVAHGITRLEEILREFRDFVVATKLEVSPQDVNALVRDTVQECTPHCCRVKVKLELQPDLPPVSADPNRLRRALSELVENAYDFMPADGVVTFTTRLVAADEPRDISEGLPTGELVMIRAEDEGPGVPAELKERIFLPFFSTRAKGMGLGLSIVSGIIQAHRGTIREVGTPGRGARFEIYLPTLGLHRRAE